MDGVELNEMNDRFQLFHVRFQDDEHQDEKPIQSKRGGWNPEQHVCQPSFAQMFQDECANDECGGEEGDAEQGRVVRGCAAFELVVEHHENDDAQADDVNASADVEYPGFI